MEGDVVVRKVKRISGLYDVAMVANPAYLGTSVGSRSVEETAKELGELMERSQPEALKRPPQAPTEEEQRRTRQMQEDIALLRSSL